MLGLLTATGSVALVGVWVYRLRDDKALVQRKRGQTPAWWQATWQRLYARVWPAQRASAPPQPATPVPASVVDLPFASPQQSAASQTSTPYGFHTSTLALGVTTVGRLCFPPLQVAGLPLLIYMGIPAAQQAYDQLAEEGRPGWALAETVVLTVCLASGAYWVGSLGFWLYYGGRHLLARQPQSGDVHQSIWELPTTAHLWKEGVTCAVPTATLQPGDQVILHSGELAPVDGLITEGVALLRPPALSAARGLHKSVGDKVAAADLVLVGRICVQVSPPA